jgi:hypothetical protein
LLRSTDRDRTRGDDNIDLQANEFRRKLWESVKMPFVPAVFDGNVPPLDPSKIAHPSEERFHGRRAWEISKESYPMDFTQLLRLGGKRRNSESK